jgi:hypothetical protein
VYLTPRLYRSGTLQACLHMGRLRHNHVSEHQPHHSTFAATTTDRRRRPQTTA